MRKYELTIGAAKNIINGWCKRETEEFIGLPKIEDVEIDGDCFCAYLDFGAHGDVHLKVINIDERVDFEDDFDIDSFQVKVCTYDDNYEECNWWDTSIKFFWMKLGER